MITAVAKSLVYRYIHLGRDGTAVQRFCRGVVIPVAHYIDEEP